MFITDRKKSTINHMISFDDSINTFSSAAFKIFAKALFF